MATATLGKVTANTPADGSAGDSSLPDPSSYAKWTLLGLLSFAAILAVALNGLHLTAKEYKPTGANFSLVAGFYVAAQVIERLLELVSPVFPLWGYQTKAAAKAAKAAKARGKGVAPAGQPDGAAPPAGQPAGGRAAAPVVAAPVVAAPVVAAPVVADPGTSPPLDGVAKAAQIKADRATVMLGAATVLGVIGSCVFGLFFLKTIGMQVNHTVDAFATGVTIGAGTKPLHDLISLIQNQTTPTTGTSA
jgi:hypothetical protein